MGLIKEPKGVDFSTKSEPWTEEELSDFRKIMQVIKEKNNRHKRTGSLSREEKLTLMKQSSSDPLFLDDLKSVTDDFSALTRNK